MKYYDKKILILTHYNSLLTYNKIRVKMSIEKYLNETTLLENAIKNVIVFPNYGLYSYISDNLEDIQEDCGKVKVQLHDSSKMTPAIINDPTTLLLGVEELLLEGELDKLFDRYECLSDYEKEFMKLKRNLKRVALDATMEEYKNIIKPIIKCSLLESLTSEDIVNKLRSVIYYFILYHTETFLANQIMLDRDLPRLVGNALDCYRCLFEFEQYRTRVIKGELLDTQITSLNNTFRVIRDNITDYCDFMGFSVEFFDSILYYNDDHDKFYNTYYPVDPNVVFIDNRHVPISFQAVDDFYNRLVLSNIMDINSSLGDIVDILLSKHKDISKIVISDTTEAEFNELCEDIHPDTKNGLVLSDNLINCIYTHDSYQLIFKLICSERNSQWKCFVAIEICQDITTAKCRLIYNEDATARKVTAVSEPTKSNELNEFLNTVPSVIKRILNEVINEHYDREDDEDEDDEDDDWFGTGWHNDFKTFTTIIPFDLSDRNFVGGYSKNRESFHEFIERRMQEDAERKLQEEAVKKALEELEELDLPKNDGTDDGECFDLEKDHFTLEEWQKLEAQDEENEDE